MKTALLKMSAGLTVSAAQRHRFVRRLRHGRSRVGSLDMSHIGRH
jgi:hypothetical protein